MEECEDTDLQNKQEGFSRWPFMATAFVMLTLSGVLVRQVAVVSALHRATFEMRLHVERHLSEAPFDHPADDQTEDSMVLISSPGENHLSEEGEANVTGRRLGSTIYKTGTTMGNANGPGIGCMILDTSGFYTVKYASKTCGGGGTQIASDTSGTYANLAACQSWCGSTANCVGIEFRTAAQTGGSTSCATYSTMCTSIGTTDGEVWDLATRIIEMDVAADCTGSKPCPDCFIAPNAVVMDFNLQLKNCGEHKYTGRTSNLLRQGIWEYTFINMHATYTVSVYDNTGSGNARTFKLPPNSHVKAWCTQKSGANALFGDLNLLVWPTLELPSVDVNADFTLDSGAFLQSGAGTTDTPTGGITINGPTSIPVTTPATALLTGTGQVTHNGNVAMSQTLTVTGVSALQGAPAGAGTTIGLTGTAADLTVYGDTLQTNAPTAGTAKTFTTGTGAITLNGDVSITTNNALTMDGPPTTANPATFRVTGASTLYGTVVVDGTNTFATGTGAVTLLGNTNVGDPANTNTLQVTSTAELSGNIQLGASGLESDLTVYGDFVQGLAKTLKTGTGAITFSGHIGIDAAKNLVMTPGTGEFISGTGAITLNGNTVQDSTNTFLVGDNPSGGSPASNIYLQGSTAVSNQPAPANPFAFEMVDGASNFKGDTTIGLSGAGSTFTHYGDFEQADGSPTASPQTSTFKVGDAPAAMTGYTGAGFTITANDGGPSNGGPAGGEGCIIDTSTGCLQTPNYPNAYSDPTTLSNPTAETDGLRSASCVATINGKGYLSVVAFETESTYDKLTITGPSAYPSTVYTGSFPSTGAYDHRRRRQMLPYLTTAAETITWTADSTSNPATVGGWRLCLDSVRFDGSIGGIDVAHGYDIVMSNTGAGKFTTGTGAISIHGSETTVAQSKLLNVYSGSNMYAVGCPAGGSDPGSGFPPAKCASR